ncbi:unnamed protein product [Arctia plantaginis]|uniref:Uncharacterized protein n=1 Tax=Arctia plantaginis TaxID=874455 RepID=A0A8S1A650_ARCPL|nr:unnamed protein product [Arctia plantaginis]
MFQYVINQPTRDYILAYIPVEEFEYLTNAEAVPTTSYKLVLPEEYDTGAVIVIDETTYYNGLFNSIGGTPIFLNQGLPVYTFSTAIPIYQQISLPTISVLPSVSVPTITISAPVSFPTTSISIPTLPLNYVKHDKVYEDPPVEEVAAAAVAQSAVAPIVESVPATTAPISGTIGFNGMVPASGKIKIYAHCF